jgi:hypothetical protein
LSCETNQKKASAAGAPSGVSALGQKIGHVTGAVSRKVTRSIGQASSKTLAVAESFDGPRSLDSLSTAVVGLEAGSWLWSRRQSLFGKNTDTSPATGGDITVPDWLARGVEKRQADEANRSGKHFFGRAQQAGSAARRWRNQSLLAVGALKLGNTAGTFAGTGLARLTRAEAQAAEQRFFFPNTTKFPVGVWQSKLTPLLNRVDSGLGKMRRSDGTMLEIKGKTWHRGTLVIDTAQGERTITHIQSMSLPQQHYYFSRRLSDNEAVGLVTGQKGFDPKYMKGYVGQVSEVESLTPTWARTKKSLIRGQLLWGDSADKEEEPAIQSQGQAKASPPQKTKVEPPTGKPRTDQSGLFPLEKIGDRVSLEGKDYPVIVRRVVNSPMNKRPLADAAYYDPEADAWKVVIDEEARGTLANQVRAGTLQLWPVEKEKDGDNQ